MNIPHGGIIGEKIKIPPRHAQGVPFEESLFFKTPDLIRCSITLFKIQIKTPIISGQKPFSLLLFVQAKKVINNKSSIHGIIGKKLNKEKIMLKIIIALNVVSK